MKQKKLISLPWSWWKQSKHISTFWPNNHNVIWSENSPISGKNECHIKEKSYSATRHTVPKSLSYHILSKIVSLTYFIEYKYIFTSILWCKILVALHLMVLK